ncbi:hypothetical protein CPC08DRAFT_703964 [Agrocybe pediades]|nr:hypothetical protein CPC08DRAFT_703964 [Agrocybe pediades]
MVCVDCEHAIHPIPLDSMTTCPGRTSCTACVEAFKLETHVIRAMNRLKDLLRKLAAQRQTVNYAHIPHHNLFSYLTLPHLRYLEYSISTPLRTNHWDDVTWAFTSEQVRDDEFLRFIKRSACPVEVLKVNGVGWNEEFFGAVCGEMPSISHLGVHTRCNNYNASDIPSMFLRHLYFTAKRPREDFPLDSLFLPNLRHMLFYSEPFSSLSIPWSYVSGCFGPVSEFKENNPKYRRLRSLEVHCHPRKYDEVNYIDKCNLLELIELRRVGARIGYWYFDYENKFHDYLTASMQYHGLD